MRCALPIILKSASVVQSTKLRNRWHSREYKMRSSWLRLAVFSVVIFFVGANLGFAETPPAQTAGLRVRSIGPILITVANMERSVEFYSRVLTFEKTSDAELAGEQVEHLFGLFGARVRVVRMTLGTESIELVQFLAPRGRP